jgi:flagellar biosynthetic protein FliR
MVISTASGLSNAQIFNPSLAAQGSLIGAFLSITGVLILFTANLHHLLITGIVESYELFPLGTVPEFGSMAQMIARTVSTSFAIGLKIGAPFVVLIVVLYAGMGVLSRLMPQVQVFMIAIPVQILLSLVTMMLVLSAIFLFWAQEFEEGLIFFLKSAGAG